MMATSSAGVYWLDVESSLCLGRASCSYSMMQQAGDKRYICSLLLGCLGGYWSLGSGSSFVFLKRKLDRPTQIQISGKTRVASLVGDPCGILG